MKNTLLVDTGFWIALINESDRHHLRAVEFLTDCTTPLITTWPVLTETCHLLLKKMGVATQLQFIDSLRKAGVELYSLRVSDLGRLHELMNKYADLPMDLADGSLVILAEALGHGRILSTDQRDFHTFRWKNHQPFENLLLPD